MKTRIKTLRKTLGLTQTEFANKLGIRQQSVGRWEHGENPHPSRIFQMCQTFGVNKTWLETGGGEMFVKKDDAKVDEAEQNRKLFLSLFEQLPEPLQQIVLDALDKYIEKHPKKEPEKEAQPPKDAAPSESDADLIPLTTPPRLPTDRIAADSLQ